MDFIKDSNLHRLQNPLLLLLLLCFIIPSQNADADNVFSLKRINEFQNSIIDRRLNLNKKFELTKRRKTDYIIVHTSEFDLSGTLNAVLRGKFIRGKRVSYGGHAHYVIARDGRTFRTLDKKYRADHAGLSMWGGRTDISDVSIGIELVGYHYDEITEKQYESVGLLIKILQRIYALDDSSVLTHSQVAYGNPNRWIRHIHRGRKRCAKNFVRTKAGLKGGWSYDPDVRAGRLVEDRELANIYYRGKRVLLAFHNTNKITKDNTAWSIAGEDFDSPTTIYQLPNGRKISGDKMEHSVGWDDIPVNTMVLLNQRTFESNDNHQRVLTVKSGQTPWALVGREYRHQNTIYFLPFGSIKKGSEIKNWDKLPPDTRLIVGYKGPFKITPKKLPIHIAGDAYNDRNTLYLFPNNRFISGDKVKSFQKLPSGVLVFLSHKEKKSNS